MTRHLILISLLFNSVAFAQADYSAEMNCLGGILDYQFLNRGEHKYSVGQSAALKKNGSLTVYPFEDSKTPGLFHFYTRQNGYSHEFNFPHYNYARYQNRMKRLDDQLEKINADTEIATKEENCDTEKIVGELAIYGAQLDKNWDESKLKAAMTAKVDELFKPYPRSHALFVQYLDVQSKRNKLAQNPPWGLVGKALGNFMAPLPEGEINIVPFINREFYGLNYDGAPWRDVKVFAPENGCGDCLHLELKPESQEVATTILSREVTAKLDVYWSRLVSSPYGNLLSGAKKSQGIQSTLKAARESLAQCSSIPGVVGLKAADYVRQIDSALPQ